MAHEADAQGFSSHRAEAAADLDAVVCEEGFAEGRLVLAGGRVDAVERVEAVFWNVGEAERFEAGAQAEVSLAMAFDADFEAFLEDDGEGFAEGVGHVDGGGVVIHAPAAPAYAGVVFAEHRDVEIPGLRPGLAGVHGSECALAEADGREARGAGEAFLRAAVDGVQAPIVHAEFVAAE